MRYIRTQYEIIPTELSNGWKLKCIGSGIEIIKQADTIEELCDAYVMRNPENNIHHFCKYECWFELQTIAKEHKDLEIYSAIWTDKGLIYVAKMNEKGELELL